MDALKKTRLDLLGPEVNTVVVWLLAFGMLAVWLLAHWFKGRLQTRFLQCAAFAVRIIIGGIAVWAVWQAVSRVILLTTGWRLWTHAFLAAIAIELAVVIYQLEKRIVAPKLGKLLLALRLAAIAAVLFLLVQPVFRRSVEEEIERKVVVLIDDSASMRIADPQMSVEEKVALAQFFGIDALKNRPQLTGALQQLKGLQSKMGRLHAALEVPEGFGSDAESEIIEKQKPLADQLAKEAGEIAESFRETLKQIENGLSEEQLRVAQELRRSLKETFRRRVDELIDDLNKGRLREARAHLKQALSSVDRVIERSPSVLEAADEQFYKSVQAETRKAIDDVAGKTRAELAKETMFRPRDGKSLMESLKEKYGVMLVRFGKKSAEISQWDFPATGEDEEFRLRTDLTGALDATQKAFQPENLAGVLLLSDARHNTDVPVDDLAMKLGRQGSPICPVLIGSKKGSKDASIVDVGAPQSIYQGDRLRTRLELKADGMRGEKVKIVLLADGAQVAEETVSVPEDSFRSTVRLSYMPKESGIFSHTVKIEPVEGELFKNNNEWSFQTAICDDRTTVLLIDDRPRWEFRYLRNLFDSRDKSVHLQYVLMHPDELDAERRPDRAASASAKFGDSEASRLPENADEWKKFDAIILGDLQPATLGEETWAIIRDCVENRGAMLVMIAGPNAMPHAYTNENFKVLCPVRYEAGPRSYFSSPEPAYRIDRTPSGLNHYIMQMSTSQEQSRQIWSELPLLRWRHPILGIHEGADVLAYAKPVQLDASGDEITDATVTATLDPAALTKIRQQQETNALVVASQVGVGKVLMLNFDHTWRFRYGVGDTHHHKFWSNILRWGTGENLRAGTETVRLGTENLTYEPGQPIRYMAKLMEQDYRPVKDSDVTVTIYRGSEKVSRRRLQFVENSHGMYEVLASAPTQPGDYRVELTGDDVERLLSTSGVKTVETKFTVSATGNPVEYGDLSVDKEVAAKLASLSGGIVTTPSDAHKALEFFGPPSKTKEEMKETRLWDNWVILLTAIGLLTAEWIFRRRSGLV